MSRKQYHAITVLLLGMVLLVAHVNSNCPNNKVCECTSSYINCTCTQREKIIFREGQDEFLGEEFIITGCGEIKLMKLSLAYLEVRSVHISDLLELKIEPAVFEEAIITNLHISNIRKFYLYSHGFAYIKNITNLIISNVTLEKFETAVFGDTTVSHLNITDSNIESFVTQSLKFENVESVRIENNNISTIKVSAIKLINIKKFSFIHNSVNSTESDSFSLSSAKEVDFGYCRFTQLSSHPILTKEVDLFEFHHNYIGNCEEKAFWGVQLTKRVRFVNNKILVAKTDSLIPNHGPNEQTSADIVNENNEIGCDCNIEWLLKLNTPKYDSIKEKNVCYHPKHLKGLNLSLLTIFTDKNGNCTSIGALTTTGASFITTPTSETKDVFTDHYTTTSREGDIAQSGGSSEQLTKDQLNPCHAKQGSVGSSANTYLCNTILLYVLLIISFS